jgi:gas vesicle protein
MCNTLEQSWKVLPHGSKIAFIGLPVAVALICAGTLITISIGIVIGMLSAIYLRCKIGQAHLNTQKEEEQFNEARQALSEVGCVANDQVEDLKQAQKGIDAMDQNAEEIDNVIEVLQEEDVTLQEQIESIKNDAKA